MLNHLNKLELPSETLQKISQIINQNLPPEKIWQQLSKNVFTPAIPFLTQLAIFKLLYPNWFNQLDSAPAWIPTELDIQNSNIYKFMQDVNLKNYRDFHAWSVKNYSDFMFRCFSKLNIHFKKKPTKIAIDLLQVEDPQWLPDATFNIADSCFRADKNKTAIIFYAEENHFEKISYFELDQLSNQVANGLVEHGFVKGDAIAIDLPMTIHAVAIYLGIIKMGGVVISIADSFSDIEIATRLNIANAKAIFTQDIIHRDGKVISLYEKVIAAGAPLAIVIPARDSLISSLRKNDIEWQHFISDTSHFETITCDATDYCNILFSSGTTGIPKAIPWTHATPLKAAIDAYFHHNLQTDDVVAWPTNLGWMMGPWLIFAGLINQATLAIYPDKPTDYAFGKFVQDAKVTVLGLVPTLVSSWRKSKCMESLDWSAIKLFSSTGECSNPEDMLYLMFLAGYKPIIEYCGGTEIGGSYVTSTIIENNYPSVLTTPAIGMNFLIFDEAGNPANIGEVALIPPAIGLSIQLLNADHHAIYFQNMPKSFYKLRRHGDRIQRLEFGYNMLGRDDDTMNLVGIKTSSVEIERALIGIPHITETAAIASNAEKGPSKLIIYAVGAPLLDKNEILQKMQTCINQRLNPLFKIHEVILVSELPKTASNKIIRRALRQD